MKVGVVGAGAIGVWIAARLAAAGVDVVVLARGATLEAIRARGLRLRDASGDTTVKVTAGTGAELGVVDVLVVAVKGPALAGAARAARPMIDPHTIIVPMLNGVPWWFVAGELGAEPLQSIDPGGAIERALPSSQVIGCVVHASCSSPEPGLSVPKMTDALILGEPKGAPSERLRTVAVLLGEAGLPVRPSAKIRYEVWYKLWGNMTMNPISALTGATCDRILDDPLVEKLVLNIMHEAAALGARIGCAIPQSGSDRNAVTRTLGAFKTSMLQDVEAGRPIELDLLLAAPREIAARLAMPTPFIDSLFGLTRLFAESRGLYRREDG
ncbi:MAG: 2-dehydropantoate 2-reductase [Pseudomonadota bacterium]|nr:2-dehydropantoate 2-reductase [Pseudomonadota bacterium]